MWVDSNPFCCSNVFLQLPSFCKPLVILIPPETLVSAKVLNFGRRNILDIPSKVSFHVAHNITHRSTCIEIFQKSTFVFPVLVRGSKGMGSHLVVTLAKKELLMPEENALL
jgi:hypothetical protein